TAGGSERASVGRRTQEATLATARGTDSDCGIPECQSAIEWLGREVVVEDDGNEGNLSPVIEAYAAISKERPRQPIAGARSAFQASGGNDPRSGALRFGIIGRKARWAFGQTISTRRVV